MEEITTVATALEKTVQQEPKQAPIFPLENESDLKTVGYYKQVIANDLSPEVFRPYPKRLIFLGGCAFFSLGGFLLIVNGGLSWPLKLVLALLIGYSNGIMAFIGHEITHGSVVKNPKLQDALFFFAALPFFISPTFWKFWHNKLHHTKTQQLIRDPDAFPNLRIYKSSKFMQFMFPYTPGSGHKRSALYFFFWFSFHNFVAQTYLRFRNSVFDSLNHKRVNLEFGAQLLIGIGLLAYAGPSNWLWVFILPLFAQNYLLMSYIATNHNLSPLTNENDPLINTLSVSNHPLLEKLNVNFGYHVEHHIYPTVNGARIKPVHFALKKHFPSRYQILPKAKAMGALYKTARIYKNSTELINPETRETFPTI